jgi:hypothetical protein
MQTSLPLWCSALAALAMLSSSTGTPVEGPPTPRGHLIVQVEGDAKLLTITCVTPKNDKFGGVPRGLQSAFEIVLIDGKGAELARCPIDLSAFDLERVGGPVHVEGCVVRDPRVAALVNVPFYLETASLRIERDGRVLGQLGGEALQRMIAERRAR